MEVKRDKASFILEDMKANKTKTKIQTMTSRFFDKHAHEILDAHNIGKHSWRSIHKTLQDAGCCECSYLTFMKHVKMNLREEMKSFDSFD